MPSVVPGLGQKGKWRGKISNDFHISTIFLKGVFAHNYVRVFGIGVSGETECHDDHCIDEETEAALPCRL